MAVLGLAACGGGARESVVVRVGESAITAKAFAHWMSVMAPQHVVPQPPHYDACVAHRRVLAPHSGRAELEQQCQAQYAELKRQALDYLIAAEWLTGEATEQGLGVSSQEIKQRLEGEERSLPNGQAEFQEALRATARTASDSELEIRAELAASKLRQRLIDGEPKITQAQIATYYRRNIQRYHIPERRSFYIVENLKSEADARRLKGEIARGRSIAATSLHESFYRSSIASTNGEKRTILRAIFAAKPHVVAEPVRLNRYYFLVEVTQVTPATVRSLAQAQASIERQLSTGQRRRTLANFIEAWRKKWIARTDCHPGYVVQKCRQYDGVETAEDPLSLT